MQEQQREWIKSFENKTESELKAMSEPTGLPTVFVEMWRRDRDAALLRLEREAAANEAQQKASVETALSAMENDNTRMEAPRPSVPPQPPLEIPKGNVADLLEQQIGMCAALIGTITDHVALDPSDPSRYHLMDRVSAMLSSSAGAARVVGQLRGIAAETKQTFITQQGGKGAGGVPQT